MQRFRVWFKPPEMDESKIGYIPHQRDVLAESLEDAVDDIEGISMKDVAKVETWMDGQWKAVLGPREVGGDAPLAPDMAEGVDILRDLAAVLNCYSQENRSNTPDFVLAGFVLRCLHALDEAVNERDRWYHVALRPGASAIQFEVSEQVPPGKVLVKTEALSEEAIEELRRQVDESEMPPGPIEFRHHLPTETDMRRILTENLMSGNLRPIEESPRPRVLFKVQNLSEDQLRDLSAQIERSLREPDFPIVTSYPITVETVYPDGTKPPEGGSVTFTAMNLSPRQSLALQRMVDMMPGVECGVEEESPTEGVQSPFLRDLLRRLAAVESKMDEGYKARLGELVKALETGEDVERQESWEVIECAPPFMIDWERTEEKSKVLAVTMLENGECAKYGEDAHRHSHVQCVVPMAETVGDCMLRLEEFAKESGITDPRKYVFHADESTFGLLILDENSVPFKQLPKV